MKIYELYVYNCGAVARFRASTERKNNLLASQRRKYESACEMALNKRNRGE